MSIKSDIHTLTTGILNTLSLFSAGVVIYSTGRSLSKYTVINEKFQSNIKEFSVSVNHVLDSLDRVNSTINVGTWLKGGRGYDDGKPNWTEFNNFIDKHSYYPAVMIAESVIANKLVGFNTNLALTLPLFHIIDDGVAENDGCMFLIFLGIAAVDALHWLTNPTPEDCHPEYHSH